MKSTARRSRYWLIPSAERPASTRRTRACRPMTSARVRRPESGSLLRRGGVWKRSSFLKSLKSRVAFMMLSRLYRQMYANTGIATDSARVSRSQGKARLLAKIARKLFVAKPMPELQVPRARRPAAPAQTVIPVRQVG